jgi:hypothetical protein
MKSRIYYVARAGLALSRCLSVTNVLFYIFLVSDILLDLVKTIQHSQGTSCYWKTSQGCTGTDRAQSSQLAGRKGGSYKPINRSTQWTVLYCWKDTWFHRTPSGLDVDRSQTVIPNHGLSNTAIRRRDRGFRSDLWKFLRFFGELLPLCGACFEVLYFSLTERRGPPPKGLQE